MHVNFVYGSVTVKYVCSFRYQKCAGIHWFKYYYLHKSSPCSEDFGRFDGVSYTEWGIRSRLFSNRGAVRFLQVCTRTKAGLKHYLLLILCSMLMFCKGKSTIMMNTVEERCYKAVVWYWHFGKNEKRS